MKLPSIFSVFLLSALLPAATQAQYYQPVQTGVTRAAFVQLLIQDKGIPLDGGNCFKDVTNQAFAPAVCAAKQYGIVSGDPAGTFRPNAPILFVEAAAMVVRAEGAIVPYDPLWYVPYIEQLNDWDAMPSSVNNIFGYVTSSQAYELINEAQDQDGDDEDEDDNDDLELRITTSDDDVEGGDRVTYRIRIENTSNDDLENIDVSAELDDEMKYISSSEDGDENGDTVEWENLDIDEDETLTLVLTVELDDDLDDGDEVKLRAETEDETVTNTLEIGDEDDDDDDDDRGLERLSITDSPDPVEAGDELVYTIRLENNDDERTDVDVRAELDEDTTFISASDSDRRSGHTVIWDDVRLNAGQEKTLTLRVRVDNSADDGDELELRVEANDEEDTETTEVEDEDDNDDDDDDNDEDVHVTISDSPDPADRGDQLEYRITIDNQENRTITIDARAILDEDTSFLFASGSADLEGDDEVVWEDIRIERNQSRTLSLTVRVSNNADRNSVLRLDVEAGNDEDTETTEVD